MKNDAVEKRVETNFDYNYHNCQISEEEIQKNVMRLLKKSFRR